MNLGLYEWFIYPTYVRNSFADVQIHNDKWNEIITSFYIEIGNYFRSRFWQFFTHCFSVTICFRSFSKFFKLQFTNLWRISIRRTCVKRLCFIYLYLVGKKVLPDFDIYLLDLLLLYKICCFLWSIYQLQININNCITTYCNGYYRRFIRC